MGEMTAESLIEVIKDATGPGTLGALPVGKAELALAECLAARMATALKVPEEEFIAGLRQAYRVAVDATDR